MLRGGRKGSIWCSLLHRQQPGSPDWLVFHWLMMVSPWRQVKFSPWGLLICRSILFLGRGQG